LCGKAHGHENENDEHLKGKRVIFELASKLNLKAKLEHPISKHVTDAYFEGNHLLAIEFQCSKCNSNEVSDRTETYEDHGIAAFWVLGKKIF
jgi:competence protein CoiA